jgi:hypothetical protein
LEEHEIISAKIVLDDLPPRLMRRSGKPDVFIRPPGPGEGRGRRKEEAEGERKEREKKEERRDVFKTARAAGRKA